MAITASKRTIIFRFKKAAEGINAMQKHAGGRRRIITQQEDSYVSQVGKRSRNTIPRQISPDLATAVRFYISARTISFPLNQVGLHARKPVRCISLQSCYHSERLRWIKEHIG